VKIGLLLTKTIEFGTIDLPSLDTKNRTGMFAIPCFAYTMTAFQLEELVSATSLIV
jgi:hypothetical protein